MLFRSLVAAFVLATVFSAPAVAHFLLNVNIRILQVEHLSNGLRVYLRLPTPYLLAPLVGSTREDGSVEPAPYTTNRLVDGQLMHYLDPAALRADPEGLGRLIAEGHDLVVEGQSLMPEIEAVRVYPAVSQPAFSTLEEARRAFNENPVFPDGVDEIFAGDSVVDVMLRYRTDSVVYDYSFASRLVPGIEGQDETANLIIDHFSGEPLIFRATGLLSEPVQVSRSALKAATGFILEGIRHILEGTDHVLFVLCLTIGEGELGALLWRVTGFTLGHTITLILGFFGFVPQGTWFVPAIETGIALSIIYAAVIAIAGQGQRSTLVVTSSIGLLHGLGFSFVLHEILRLDAPNLWQSLLSFNLGVEIGQIGIVLLVWPVFWLLTCIGDKPLRAGRWALALPAAMVAAMWTGERLLVLFATL